MNKKLYLNLSFTCLIYIMGISSIHAEAKSSAPVSDTIITQAELAQCNEKSKALTQTAEQLNEELNRLTTLKNNINQIDQDRKQMSAGIDFHDPVSVDKYNQINTQIKQLSQTYSNDIEKYNSAVKQYKIDINRLKTECDNKQYYKTD